MGFRGELAKVRDWLGLNTFADAENLAPSWWIDAMNVIVSQSGSAECLRSPAPFNDDTAIPAKVLSVFDYDKNSGNLILFDIVNGSSVSTYKTTGTTNTVLRTGQANNARWKRLFTNDFAYGLNGTEFVQTNGTTTYKVGVDPPAAAPTISYVAGGAGDFVVGVNVSYAYRNSTTHAVSVPTDFSNTLGATSTLHKLRIPVTASIQTGVDGIVIYATLDGGIPRYLVIDSNGDPQVFANTTGNIDISIADIFWDTLTEETVFNVRPPDNAFFMFKWKDRIFLCDFRGATTKMQLQYSGFEAIAYGTPSEAWPPLNLIYISNKSDACRAGIETVNGALVLAEQDSYLLTGYPSDKVDSPENTVAVTEHLEPLGWKIGTRSPYTLVTTPFGEIWFDQTKRVQIWDHSGNPVEIGVAIRNLLSEISDTDAGRAMAEGAWFQHGENGGNYVLTASSDGLFNDRVFILSLYRDPESGEVSKAWSISDLELQCLGTAEVSGTQHLLAGVLGKLVIFLEQRVGVGWDCQERFFQFIAGNDDEFCVWHSLKFDCADTTGLTIIVSNFDDSEPRTLVLEQESGAGSSWYALIDEYGHRKMFTFIWDATDTLTRVVKNVRVAYKNTSRLI